MKTKLALSLIAAALTTACAGTPTWDNTTFPSTPVYGNADRGPIVAEIPGENMLFESRGD
jgi:hypothetical protein